MPWLALSRLLPKADFLFQPVASVKEKKSGKRDGKRKGKKERLQLPPTSEYVSMNSVVTPERHMRNLCDRNLSDDNNDNRDGHCGTATMPVHMT